ncbi:uncharacterized protein B0H64DRAFT_397501 [Chaetomium fimeti]|uniref:Pentatricopeptide repeat-containing protein n=1 Tax=Chaetomium fimeti TaxID=1854472 RepID=A0AAE0LSR1_9PEZI|nr:hypothetical protein B0H64DRAFT_397501 [Chaetomium fimeti]
MRELGSVGSICLRCQFRLLVTPHARARRGISTSSSAAVIAEDARNDTRTSDGALGAGQSGDGPSIAPLPTPQHPMSSSRSSSVAMFQSIVQSQAQVTPGIGTTLAGAASIELVRDVSRLQKMMAKEGATLPEAYAYFEETVYPQIKQGGGVSQIVKNHIGTVLLNRLAFEKPRDFDASRLPSVTRITEIMVELDVLRPSAWATLVIALVQHIYRQNTVPDSYNSIKDYETAMARRDVLVYDLLGAWRVFCSQRPSLDGGSSPARPLAKPQQQLTLQKAFGAMFPQYLVPSLLRPTFAAFATYKLLTDAFSRARATKGEAAPFLQMMTGLIFQTRAPRPADFNPIFDTFPDLPRFVWPKRQDKARVNTFLEPVASFGEGPSHVKASVHRQLGDAIKSMHLRMVEDAWLEFWGDAATPDAARTAELVECPEMFDYFILAYTMMRRPQHAVAVWNNMERIGIRPTIKTWTSMLHGCAKANNARGIKTIWEKLLASGIRLDAAIWTARINGLFVCGEPDAGLRALDEMAKIWAARSDRRFAAVAVQPGVEAVNAALSGLLRFNNRDSDATRVLAWASKRGIEPDIYTFNTLLRPLVRRGDLNGIDGIFATMRSTNIRADVATFTVLLEGTLNQIGGLPPAQQVSLVERILAAMKAAGVEINMQVYAKFLHLLLRDDRAEEPVKAVLAHIWGRGLELTSHIYTMLADHYFSRDPPDSAAVTALVENRRLHDNKSIDRVFWERLITGYGHAGDVRRALGIFDRVFAGGSGTITFGTLYDLLRPLVEIGDREAALRVVEAGRKIGKADEVGAGQGGGEGTRYWKHRFWHLAYREGLMGEQLAERFREGNI